MRVYLREGNGFWYAVDAERPHITVERADTEEELIAKVNSRTVAAYEIEPEKASVWLQLDAGPDRTGNPKRLAVKCTAGKSDEIVEVWDMGYKGLPDECHLAGGAICFQITPGEYRGIIRTAKEAGKFRE